jgi:nucleoside-diphosphate-sugar epimerase
VLNTFIEKALRQKDIRLLDDGAARRTYCYIADAMHMLWLILMEGKASVYNVGGVSRTTIAELAHQIGGLTGVPVHIPDSSAGTVLGAPDDVRVDVSRFENEFGKMTFIPLEQGLKRAIEWQRESDARDDGMA